MYQLVAALLSWHAWSYFLEYDADLFAAKIVGQERYVSMLKNLDLATNGKLSQGNFVHPILNKRIAYVKKHLP